MLLQATEYGLPSRKLEICSSHINCLLSGGRPFAGAWIEQGMIATPVGTSCRPFAGAWIETSSQRAAYPSPMVAPSRGRGSKRIALRRRFDPLEVAPSRGRGSKQLSQRNRNAELSRPFAGAWIETRTRSSRAAISGRPFAGAWIETWKKAACDLMGRSPLRGGVDRNTHISKSPSEGIAVAPSRGRGSKRSMRCGWREGCESPLRGGVDRNCVDACSIASISSRPFAGAWIETARSCRFPAGHRSRPSRGRGSKQRNVTAH